MNIISFCIYGSTEKYCRGLIENLEIIKNKLPNYCVFIYMGNDVPEEYIKKYNSYSFVKIFITNKYGHDNMINRFYAIDEPNVNIAFIRDADSRIHERDLWCINHFIDSPYTFNTARDHPYHTSLIMGGLWGIKKNCLQAKISDLYKKYNSKKSIINLIQHDQNFLRDIIYPLVNKNMIIYVYNIKMKMMPKEIIYKIPFNVVDNDFCGQVVIWTDNIEIKNFIWNSQWNN